MLCTPLFSGLFQRKGSYLFYSVGNNGTILFVVTKRSRFILYSISTNTQWGVATGEFILEVGELLKLRETLTRVYVQRTGKPLWVVSEDMERDVFMSATEAQAYGIVDLVAVE
ncbi:hypothetical protein L6452_45639 [Arctium lappa]|nr:hypothetical protein L6452_45639 [Arctium lappa]